jgi:hypothetical protein
LSFQPKAHGWACWVEKPGGFLVFLKHDDPLILRNTL